MIGYPTNRLVAVLDDPAAASSAATDLRRSGLAPADVLVLTGPDGIRQLARLGSTPAILARIVRAFQFMTMDQMPDFVMYEAALRDGRALVAVRVSGGDGVAAASDILARHGAHFANWFGRLTTQELSAWRGPEPAIPGYLRR